MDDRLAGGEAPIAGVAAPLDDGLPARTTCWCSTCRTRMSGSDRWRG